MNSRPLRKDAERNRDALIAAAHDLFAERGLSVGLNEIAKAACVGVGTAYRHFPEKDQLVDILFQRRLDEVMALARAAQEDPDPWHGITVLLTEWLRLHVNDRGLTQIFLDPEVGQERADASRDLIAPLLDTLADRARERGQTRPDFRGTDIFFMQLALVGLVDRSRTFAPEIHRRYLAMLLEGARSDPHPTEPLPVAALGVNETHSIVTAHHRKSENDPSTSPPIHVSS